MTSTPQKIGIIAGRGAYPLELAQSARVAGVAHIFVAAFRGETRPELERYADAMVWLKVGQLASLLKAFSDSGVNHAVMAGQIRPRHLFHVRPDRMMLDVLKNLRVRNAETIFGAVSDRLREVGVEILPANLFMEDRMPLPGILTATIPTPAQQEDIELGFKVAGMTSGLDIGQTVVIKEGTVLAVEAFEGTDPTILRAGKLGGGGAVVVKVAKETHDMRFDIPVVGMKTLKTLKKARAAVLALEAGRTILLEKDAVIAEANRRDICICAMQMSRRVPGE